MSEDSRSRRSFRSALRGYDRVDVDRLIGELESRLEQLEKERSILQARLGDMEDGGGEAVRSEVDAVGEEVGRVLTAAQEAAEGMRSRASDEAARWRAEADSSSRAKLAEAQDAAEHLRGEAWDTAANLLDQAKQQYREVLQQSQQESLTIRAEAERDAHQLVGNARKNIEEEARQSRMEAERLIAQARSEAEALTETARRDAEASQQRARALEQRRAELMEELETAQAAIGRLESDLQERKASLQAAGFDDSTVRVLPPEEPEAEWIDEDRSVRLVSSSVLGAPEPVDADDLAAEVSRLREEAQQVEQDLTPEPQPELVVDAEPEVEASDEEIEPVHIELETPAPVPSESEPEAVVEPEPSEIDSLFKSLRSPGAAAPDPTPNGSVTAVATAVATAQVPATDWAVDPFELRDRLLLPISNRALRELKRSIVEVQNEMLEELRTRGDDWSPDLEAVAAALGPELRTLAAESHVAGYTAAAELTGTNTTPHPNVEPADPTEHVGGVLVDELNDALRRSRTAGAGERELAAAVSKVFRTWRTDGAERWLRSASFASYHDGLLWGLEELAVPKVRGVVNGISCSECPGALGERWTPGETLPEGTGIPPIHVDCQCTLAPLT